MPVVTPGETPPAFLPVISEPVGQGRKVRATKNEQGSKRRLIYPPAPDPLPFPVVDNHTHMDFADGQVTVSVQDQLDAAGAVGVEGVVQVGCDVESSRWAVDVATQDSRVLAAVALHPNEAARAVGEGTLDAEMAQIEKLASNPRVRAIGETGLDYFRTGERGWAGQHESFRRHLDLASKYNLPVQIHDRDAHHDVLRILEEENFQGTVVFHCFSGPTSMARVASERGWYVSFGGTATFKNNHDLREAISAVDPKLLMVETDAPFLTAHPFRGRPNAPYMAPYAVSYVSALLNRELEDFCRQIRENTRRVYGDFSAADTQS